MTEQKDRILLVDDEKSLRILLAKILSGEGFECFEASSAEEALEILAENAFSLVMLDIRMSGKSGMDILPEIKAKYPNTAVIMATATIDLGVAVDAMQKGAYDFITKPFNNREMIFAVKRAIEKHRLEKEIVEYREHLEDKIIEQAGRIRASFINTIRALVYALEAKDKYTSGHSQRVADISAEIARELHLPQESIDKVVLAGLVHDIGKIGLNESILNKPGELTVEEILQVQKHPEIGERIMGPVAEDPEILLYIRHHHGSFDGRGYPDTLKGYQLPLGARILAVADAYEAMTSERPYRKALSDEAACRELIKCKNKQFDPEIVDAFIRCKDHV